ncbi:MAG: hypothetical protein KF910_08320 [Brevundimonas sp.]|uniref:hypothetical protein n=1 Tax=Brevundimonas sp. TaxID=1871086 RepID=UPI0025C5D472|nr:hypothetical protein [Brevundimonas sp.]MBX3477599.1 hypothetical protein [Brevundimonas sp.]
MLISILTLTGFMALQEPAPAAAPATEAERAADLRARAVVRCQTTPRGQGESVEACAERRVAALMGTYGTTAGALAATAGWVTNEAGPARGPLGFPTLADGLAPERRAFTPPDRTYQPPQPRCRRESTRSEDGSSSSSTLICGNGGAAEEAARRMLDNVMGN